MAKRLNNNRYEIVQELDATPFTRIYKAKVISDTNSAQTDPKQEESKALDSNAGQFVVLKKLKNIKAPEDKDAYSLKEVKVLREISDHPNVIKLLDVFVDRKKGTYGSENVFLVIEYMKLDLHSLIINFDYKLTEADVKSIMYQIFQGLACLHQKSILHRDVKPGNVLLREDGLAKISDFGSSRVCLQNDHEMTPRVTTRYYRSPEMLYGAKNYTNTVDTWAAGCTMAEIILRRPLFPGSSEIDQLSKVFEVLGTPNEETWASVNELPNFIPFEPINKVPLEKVIPGVSAEALDLLEKLLALDPSKRLTSEEALKHPYFSSGVSKDESTYQKFVSEYVPKKKRDESDDY